MESALLFLIVSSLIASSFTIPIEKADDGDKYLLPTIIKPQSYDITLKLDKDFPTTKKFSGVVIINFNVDKDKTTKDIKLHSKGQTISSATLTKDDDKKTPVELNPGPYTPDPDTDILTLTSKTEDLKADVGYILTIEYDSLLQSDKSMMGFYLSTYKDGDTVKYVAATQFEQSAARQAFPCFDEPSFKAAFTFTISYPSGYNVITNTPKDGEEKTDGDLKQMKFKQTPKMSTYLVAFVVSQYTCDGGANSGAATTEVCSRDSTKADREVAKTVGPKVLDLMNSKYTKVAYEKHNTKLSQIAIPDFKLGAMENWGAVTFRERDVLWNENESSNKYKQSVVTVVAHELSHQWFGDLVTLNWWSNTFLNEGFGTYFQYHVPAQISEYNTWRLEEQFVVEQVHTALEADALKTSTALSSDVSSPNSDSKFDTISYNKGGSVLRMVHHFVEEANFITGLQKYIADKSLQNVLPDDLWNSFDTVEHFGKIKVVDMMQTWTKNPGYPVLTVKATGDDITISQKRFLIPDDDDATKWFVPISYTLNTDESADTKTKQMLTPTEDLTIKGVLTDVAWIVLNNEQTGFYRVNYDDALLKKLSTVLSSTTDSNKITPVNKAQIIDDLFALARAGTRKYASVLDVLTFLTAETDYIPWYTAFRGFDLILRHTGDAATQKLLTAYVMKLMDTLYKSIDFKTEKPGDQIYTLNQVQALTWACKLNDANCVKTAKDLFVKYIAEDKPVAVTKNFKSIVYCNGLRYSDDASKDFDALWNKYAATDLSTEQVTILNGLGCAKDDTVLQKYLNYIITPSSGIRINDAAAAFSSVYTSNAEGVDSTLTFITTKYSDIKTYFGESTTLIKTIINDLTDRFTSQAQIDKINKFVTDNTNLEEDVKTAIQNGVVAAKANIKWATDFNSQIKSYFNDDGGDGGNGDGGASTVTLQFSALFGTLFVLIFQVL